MKQVFVDWLHETSSSVVFVDWLHETSSSVVFVDWLHETSSSVVFVDWLHETSSSVVFGVKFVQLKFVVVYLVICLLIYSREKAYN